MQAKRQPWHATVEALLAEGLHTGQIVQQTRVYYPALTRAQIDNHVQKRRRIAKGLEAPAPTVEHPSEHPAVVEWKARRDAAEREVSVKDPVSDAPTVESEPLGRILSLEELLTSAKVDRDVWAVERFVVNKWEVGAKDLRGQIVVEPLFQVKAWLARSIPESLEAFRAAILADITTDTQQRPRVRVTAPPPTTAEQYMVEVDLADLHVGKLSWGEETGTDYDSNIAEKLAREAVTELLWHAERYPVERFLLPVGNDLLHYELSGNTTSGTPQDADTRWLKMFRRARGVTSWMIQTLLAKAPVHVVIVPGNHARQGEMAMGEVLAAEFANDPRVSFNRKASPRKYSRYGRNLIGLTHGDGIPHEKLPQLMAVECKQAWADTIYREFHVGHIHKQKRTEPVSVDDKLGVTTRILRSLSGVDAWHASKGFISTRGAEAFVWRKSGGIVAHFTTHVRAA